VTLLAVLRAEGSVTGDVERLATIAATLRSVETLPQTVIHRDPHPGNLLFEDGQLSGILDFDLMMRGPRIFDPCYCATSLLLAQFPDARHRGHWLDLWQALLAGYRRLVPLTAAEQAGLFTMLAVIQLLFIAYALRTHRPDAASMNQSALLWLHHHRRHIEKAITV
jgi:Ser/Thr protein kinase RdoA (MazF antagonist)